MALLLRWWEGAPSAPHIPVLRLVVTAPPSLCVCCPVLCQNVLQPPGIPALPALWPLWIKQNTRTTSSPTRALCPCARLRFPTSFLQSPSPSLWTGSYRPRARPPRRPRHRCPRRPHGLPRALLCRPASWSSPLTACRWASCAATHSRTRRFPSRAARAPSLASIGGALWIAQVSGPMQCPCNQVCCCCRGSVRAADLLGL